MSFAAGLRRRFWLWVAHQINHELLRAWGSISDRLHAQEGQIAALTSRLAELERQSTYLQQTGRRD